MGFARERLIDFRCVADMENDRTYIDFVVNPGGGGMEKLELRSSSSRWTRVSIATDTARRAVT